MEQLLPSSERVCPFCKSQRLFRLSRYGCVFVCRCNLLVDVQKVLNLFIELLQTTRSWDLPFVPIVEWGSNRGTVEMRVVVLELDCLQRLIFLTFRNFSLHNLEEILASFSLSLSSQISKIDNCHFSVPFELLDFLVDELQSISSYPFANYLITRPSRNLVSLLRSAVPVKQRSYTLPWGLQSVLSKHQIEGVEQALRFNGRVLLADEMGVGKTLEAVAAVSALNAYPLLIVAPSTLKIMWAEEFEKYLNSQVEVGDIHIIGRLNDALGPDSFPKVVIVSYHMVAILGDQLVQRDWRCLLCDESHFLYTNVNHIDARYTRILVELGKHVPYCILLSGTPVLRTPFASYNQVDMLMPAVLGETRWHFAMEFCHMRFDPFIRMLECVKPIEWTTFLRSTCMVRRLKSDVLELPPKKRIILRVAGTLVRDDKHSFQEEYSLCWQKKRQGIFEAIEYCYQKYETLVLFAHHLALLDTLASFLNTKRISFIRIDGRIAPEHRHDVLQRFEEKKVKVAVIGITACATGISLASASCALFCELPPDASWMVQAEDRLHRQGQDHEVRIYYILGVHCDFDTIHFSRILESYQRVRELIDNKTGSLSLCQSSRMDSSVESYKDETREPVSTRNATQALTTMSNERLLFLISKNTGRVHIKNSANNFFYITFSMEEATECIRRRSHPIWAELDRFLLSLERHSPFYRRQLIRNGLWCSSEFNFRPSAQATGISTRYLSPMKIGWAFWWKVMQPFTRNFFYYFANLKLVGSIYTPLCLNCASSLSIQGNFNPGSVNELDTDIRMFCNGKCRETFFMKRSSKSIRYCVSKVDYGKCTNCHVNCERLCSLMANTEDLCEREEILQRYHPQFVLFPRLHRNFVKNPTPGNCWHVDHIIPVACGGGQSTLDNLQTLCVVCHALKTAEDRKLAPRGGSSLERSLSDTTVAMALERVQESQSGRVTRKRLRLNMVDAPSY